MKFNVLATDFVELAKKCLKGFNPKENTSQTIFQLTKQNDLDYLTITCYSPSTFFEGSVRIHILEDDTDKNHKPLSVDGNKLKTILSVLNTFNSQLTFTTTFDNRIFTLSSGSDNLHLPILEDVVPKKKEEIIELATISADEFIGNASKLSKVIDSNSTFKDHPKYCLHLTIKDDSVEMMATNGINLSIISQEAELLNKEDKNTLLIPVSHLGLLFSQYGANQTIKLVETPHLFGYIDNKNVLSLVAKGDMLPMPYHKFQENIQKEKSKSEKVKINTESFKTVFDNLFKLCSTSNFATMYFKDGLMYGKNDNQDVFQILIESEFDKEVSIVFDKSLSSIFNLLTDTFSLEWIPNSNGSIVQFALLKEKDNNEYEEIETTFICASSHKGDD